MSGTKFLVVDFDRTLTTLFDERSLWDIDAAVRGSLPPEVLKLLQDVGPGDPYRTWTALKQICLTNPEGSKLIKVERDVRKVLSRHEQSAAEIATPYAGAIEALNSLAARGTQLIIYSSNDERAIRTAVRRWNFAKADVVGRSNDLAMQSLKPNTSRLMEVLRGKNLYPTDGIYIGDSLEDADAAEQSKIPFVGVLTGLKDESSLKDAGANHVLYSIADIMKHICRQ